MSIEALNWVTHNPEIRTRTEYCVMMALANRTDPEGWCYPGQERLARESRSARATVQRTLDELVRKGLLERRLRRGKTNQYFMPIGRQTLPPEMHVDYDLPDLLDGGPHLAQVLPLYPQVASSGEAGVASSGEARHGEAPRRNDATPASSGEAGVASSGEARTIKNRKGTNASGSQSDDPEAWRRIPDEARELATRRIAELRAQLRTPSAPAGEA